MRPLRLVVRPEKMLDMHYVPHGWLAATFAVPFVLLAAALEKRQGFASRLFDAAAWVLTNLW
jgi:hypothetical protein